MVVQNLQGCRRASRGGLWGHNHGEVAIAIQAWQGGGQSTGGYIAVGLIINYRRSRMQDLANLDLLLPLVQYGVPMIQLTPAYNPTS